MAGMARSGQFWLGRARHGAAWRGVARQRKEGRLERVAPYCLGARAERSAFGFFGPEKRESMIKRPTQNQPMITRAALIMLTVI